MATKRTKQETVKVVIVETQFLKTEAVHFKHVVQMLTGKESSADAAATAAVQKQISLPPAETLRKESKRIFMEEDELIDDQEFDMEYYFKHTGFMPLQKEEEFDRGLFVEPSVRELYRLWAD